MNTAKEFERVMDSILRVTESARANLEALRHLAQEIAEPLNRWESEGGSL